MKPLFALLAALLAGSPSRAEPAKAAKAPGLAAEPFVCPAVELPALELKEVVLTIPAVPPDKAEVEPGAVVAINAIYDGGYVGVSYPKGGEGKTKVAHIARTVPEIAGFKPGDSALDARPGHSHNVVTIVRLFSNCMAVGSSRRGGTGLYELGALRRRLK